MKKASKKSQAKVQTKKAPKKTSSKKVASKTASKKPIKKHTIADQVADTAGAKFGDLCDYLAERDKKATLAKLLAEIEEAAGITQNLIDEVGEDALLTDEYSK